MVIKVHLDKLKATTANDIYMMVDLPCLASSYFQQRLEKGKQISMPMIPQFYTILSNLTGEQWVQILAMLYEFTAHHYWFYALTPPLPVGSD